MFRLREHLRRLRRSLQLIGIQLQEDEQNLFELATELAARSRDALPDDDLARIRSRLAPNVR